MQFKSKKHQAEYYRAIVNDRARWPKCQFCNNPIPFDSEKKKSYKDWIEDSQFCSRSCSNKHRARSRENKTCDCGRVFFRHPSSTNKSWGLRRKCNICKSKTHRDLRVNTKEKPIIRGFYVFEHVRYEFKRVGGRIQCMDPLFFEARDKKIDRIIADLS